MAITSGFFDSISGDRTYNASQMSTYFEGLVSDGIYENIGNRFIVQASSGMSVTVGTGRALIKSRWIKNDAAVTLTLDAADLQLNRIDAIVLQLDLTESGRDIDIVIKKGTPAASPTKPSITRTADVYELCLAYISVNKNTASIVQSNISDQRSSSLCGWVTGLVKQVDTSDLFLQWQAAYEQQFADFDAYMEAKKTEFENWYSTLTEELRVDTTITKYQNTVETSGQTTEITIGIPEYDSSNDVLFVYINGVFFIEGNEYEIVGSGESAKITLVKDIRGDNEVTFVVLKNVIGKKVISVGQSTSISNGSANSVIGAAEYLDTI